MRTRAVSASNVEARGRRHPIGRVSLETTVIKSRTQTVLRCTESFIIGIKHDFPFINVRKVPREVLKTEGEARGFQYLPRDLANVMNDKIMFDRYYCINSKKTHRKLRKCLCTLFFSLTTIFLRAHDFYKYPRFGPWTGTFSHDVLKA